MKRCYRCKRELPLEQFYSDRTRPDGKRFDCKDCRNEADHKKSATDSYKSRRNNYHKARRALPQNRARERRHAEASRVRYPEKAKAHRLVRTAILNGTLKVPAGCSQCGIVCSGRSLHAHHYRGYDNPLEIVWLCRSCHIAAHRALPVEAAPATMPTITVSQGGLPGTVSSWERSGGPGAPSTEVKS